MHHTRRVMTRDFVRDGLRNAVEPLLRFLQRQMHRGEWHVEEKWRVLPRRDPGDRLARDDIRHVSGFGDQRLVAMPGPAELALLVQMIVWPNPARERTVAVIKTKVIRSFRRA